MTAGASTDHEEACAPSPWGRAGMPRFALKRRGGRRVMKGQMVFEFVIATLFFLGIVMYTINVLNTSIFRVYL